MDKRTLKKLLKLGLGDAITYLRSVEDTSNYDDLILDFLVHNYVFDLQCEGIRSQYNYDLFLSSSNKLLLIEKVLTALGSNDDSIAVDQIYDLAKLLTINGDRNCIDVMKLKLQISW